MLRQARICTGRWYRARFPVLLHQSLQGALLIGEEGTASEFVHQAAALQDLHDLVLETAEHQFDAHFLQAVRQSSKRRSMNFSRC